MDRERMSGRERVGGGREGERKRVERVLREQREMERKKMQCGCVCCKEDARSHAE